MLKISNMQAYRNIAENDEIDVQFHIEYIEQQKKKDELLKLKNELINLLELKATRLQWGFVLQAGIVDIDIFEVEEKIKVLEKELGLYEPKKARSKV